MIKSFSFKKVLFFIVLMGTALSLLSQEKPYQKRKGFYEQGKREYKKHNYFSALADFQTAQLYTSDGQNEKMYCYLSSLKLNLYASALYYAERYLENSGGTSQAYTNMGVVYANLGMDDSAMLFFEKALATHSNYEEDYVLACANMAYLMTNRGRYDEALTYNRKAINADPDHVAAWFGIGVAYFETSQLDSALCYMDKTLEIEPDKAEAYHCKAAIYEKQKRSQSEINKLCKKTLKLYSASVTPETNDYRMRNLRGDVYRIMGNKKKMKEDYKYVLDKLNNLIDLHPEAYHFIFARAGIYSDLGNKEAAVCGYNRVLEINPNHEYTKKTLKELSEQ